jgi:hypothetical protein
MLGMSEIIIVIEIFHLFVFYVHWPWTITNYFLCKYHKEILAKKMFLTAASIEMLLNFPLKIASNFSTEHQKI